jgi:uncharacterized protein YndB with AHSA1/START domain
LVGTKRFYRHPLRDECAGRRHLSCRHALPQGTEHWKRGVYREIVEPERIVFTFVWENPGDDAPHNELLTTVTFDEVGTKTRLTLRQGPFATARQRDSHNNGWSSTLERFAEYLTSQLAP